MKRKPMPRGTLAGVRPSAAIEALYRKRLTGLVEEMHRSLLYWIGATYKAKPPELAQDDAAALAGMSPARALEAEMRRLGGRWMGRFNAAAPRLAQWFALSVTDRTTAALETILRDAGMSVRFQLSRAANDVLQATIAENVSLIKSIAQQHLTDVEGLVMRSVTAGRDIGGLAKELEARYQITKRRAEFIARQENNKATAVINRVRQQSVGITHAVWVHSGAGAHPRLSHVKAGADKVVYEVAKGWFDPDEGEHIWPGTLFRCRCFSRPILPKAKTE